MYGGKYEYKFKCGFLLINESLYTVWFQLKWCKGIIINYNFVSATSSLVPFLTIHMQSVGLTVEEIAIIYLALPLTTFLAPPVTGKYHA